jgi:hypothetical protein
MRFLAKCRCPSYSSSGSRSSILPNYLPRRIQFNGRCTQRRHTQCYRKRWELSSCFARKTPICQKLDLHDHDQESTSRRKAVRIARPHLRRYSRRSRYFYLAARTLCDITSIDLPYFYRIRPRTDARSRASCRFPAEY